MPEIADTLIYLAVVLGRLLFPLLIPRYPLPGVIAALVLDAVDQTIFQVFTDRNLDNYQGYDKALDIYYLTVAYISTLRNWGNLFAFKISRFLWYYRLLGVTLFELVAWRPLLLIFPNIFEYYFIFYEIVRLRWDPRQLTRRAALASAAAIWLFIKVPQEWWIHIAQLDTTDFIKEQIFGVPVDTSWTSILSSNLWVVPVLAVIVLMLLLLGRRVGTRLPAPARALPFDANADLEEMAMLREKDANWWRSERFFNYVLLEKAMLVAFVGVIFAQILPGMTVSNLQLVFGAGFVIVLNTVVSHWLARRGTTWRSALTQFGTMALLNLGLIRLYVALLVGREGTINLNNALFFALLLTLIVTLFDAYYPAHLKRARVTG